MGFYCEKYTTDLGLALNFYRNQTKEGNSFVSQWRCAELCWEDATCLYYTNDASYGGCGLATETDVAMGGGNNIKVCRKKSELDWRT